MIKSRDGKMWRSWIDSHFSGVIPRMVKVRPWSGGVEGEEGDDWGFLFLFVTVRVSKHKARPFTKWRCGW